MSTPNTTEILGYGDVRTPVPTIYGDWVEKFSPTWKSQVEKLKAEFGKDIEEVRMPITDVTDVPIVYVKKDQVIQVLAFLKDDTSFDYSFLADLTATDEGPDAATRFEVVYNLFSMSQKTRIRVKVRVKEGEEVPTLVDVWPGANWQEREVWDMFGIKFKGHPDLRRILMDQRWEGHPLRKDYPLRGYQIFPTAEPINEALLAGPEDASKGPKSDRAEKIAKEIGLDNSPHYNFSHDPDDLWDDSKIIMNIGPTHPAMHGALRMAAKLNGETIENSYCTFGYTHRAKEKLGENRTYHQFVVYTDRLNYCSALINNVTYAMSVEKLMGIEVPPRAIWIRMICAELARVIDHLICVGISAVDIGAFSFFLYGFHQREEAYTLIERICGTRLTTSYTRIGGVMQDAPDGWEKEVKAWVQKTRKTLDEMDSLLTGNKIWRQRTVGVGVWNKENCMKYSFSGPNARAAGIDHDLRRDQPSMYYKDVEFDVPIAKNGDVFDRYLVRIEEMRQSLNIIAQCCDRMKKGPVWAEDKRVRIPEKEVVHNTMEGLIHHFKFFMTGFEVPVGEAYTPFEAANGELAFYIVSKGDPKAHRMRIRGPSVWHFQGLTPMANGLKIADMVAALGSINIIAGELDR